MYARRIQPICLIGVLIALSHCGTVCATDYDELLKLQEQLAKHRNLAQFDQAEHVGKQMVALAERVFRDKPTVIADCLDQLISVYDLRETEEQAEPYCRRAIEIREKALGKEHVDLAYPYFVLGNIRRIQRRVDEAEHYFRRGLTPCESAIARGADPPVSYLGILVNLASILDDQSRYADAEPLLRKALPLAEKQSGPDSAEVAQVLNNLARIDSDQGRFEQAEALYRRSLAIKKKLLGEDHPEVGLAYSNLGLNFVRWGRLDDAEPLYLQALEIGEKSASLRGRSEFGYASSGQALLSALENLGNLKVEQRKYDQAEPYYRRALEMQEQFFGHDSPVLAQTLSNLALMYANQQRHADAEPLLDRAIELAESGGAAPTALYNMLISRSLVYWFTDKRPRAIADLWRALDIADRLRATFSGDETERAQAANYHFWRAFELMIGCQRDLGDVAAAFAAAERRRARGLVDQINLQGVDLLSGLPASEAAALREQDAKTTAAVGAIEKQFEQMASQPGVSEAQRAQDRQRLTAELIAAREKAVDSYRAIRNASPAYRLAVSRDFQPVDLATLHAWVIAQTALLLEYYVGEEHCYVIVVPADGDPQVLMLPKLNEEVATALGTVPGWLNSQRLQQALSLDGKSLSDVLKQPAARQGQLATAIEQGNWLLWQLLVPAEFHSRLVDGTYKRLIVIPDAGLQNLPFDGLVTAPATGDSAKYLLDVGPPIITGPSATVLFNLSQRPAATSKNRDRPRVLSVGDPSYASRPRGARDVSTPAARFATLRGDLQPLPFSGREMAWVAESFNPVGLTTRTLTKAEASEQAVRKYLPGCEIVHLACHGLADQTHGNLFGCLALAMPRSGVRNPSDDGFLTLAEIYALNLKQCELAILSACETNLGPQQQGEGVFALSRGFMVAGARRVVATNWIVDDESSASLVSVFCSVLAKQHQTGEALDYALALHKAKQWVRKRERWRHPYYWGAFTLVGPN